MEYAKSSDSRFGMSDRSERLNKAFREAGISQATAVERWAWSPNTLKSNLNGTIDFGMKGATKYGAALKVRPEWLYTGEEPMRAPKTLKRRHSHDIPVLAWVSAGGLADVPPEEISGAETMQVGDLPEGKYIATTVRGDSMDRVSPEGSRIIVRLDDPDLQPGAMYLFSLRGEVTYKRYQKSPVKRLEPFSTNPANETIFLQSDSDWSVIGRVYRTILDLV